MAGVLILTHPAFFISTMEKAPLSRGEFPKGLCIEAFNLIKSFCGCFTGQFFQKAPPWQKKLTYKFISFKIPVKR